MTTPRDRRCSDAGGKIVVARGLPDKYLAKLVGEHPIRRIGMTSMGPLFPERHRSVTQKTISKDLENYTQGINQKPVRCLYL